MDSDGFSLEEWDLDLAWDYYARAKQAVDSMIDQSTATDVNPTNPDPLYEEHQNSLPVGHIDDLVFLSNLLNHFESTAYGSELVREIDIHPSALSKVIKGKGFLSAPDAISLLDRIKTLLLKIENQAPEEDAIDHDVLSKSDTDQLKRSIAAEKWVARDASADVGRLIDDLTKNLEDVVEIMQRNNSLAELDGINQLRISRLKAVLKTTLNILESPMVEQGLLKTASKMAADAGKEFAKDEMKKGLSSLLDLISKQALELYVKITAP